MYYSPLINETITFGVIGGIVGSLFVFLLVWLVIDFMLYPVKSTKSFSYFCSYCGWNMKHSTEKFHNCPNCRSPITNE